jgi:SpoIID/LytB domain protein
MVNVRKSFVALWVIICMWLPLKCKADQQQRSVRVAISDNQCKEFAYDEIEIIGTGDFSLFKGNTSVILARVSRNQSAKIKLTNGSFTITIAGGDKCLKNIRENITLKCHSGFLGVKNLQRHGKQALYRGFFEITKADNGQFFLVNVVSLEDYLKSVVPNEMPIKFGIEALKAQAVVARNYAIAPRLKEFKEFDLYDSVASQVYFGTNTEHPTSNQAVKETEGIVLLHGGNPILPLYFSTSCGHTENYENAFADPKTNAFPGFPLPYLKGKPDNPKIGNLRDEDTAKKFFKSHPQFIDRESKYFRWQKEWNVQELKDILKTSLLEQKASGLVDGFSFNPNDLGDIQRIDVKRRGVSGQIMELVIVTTAQKISVKKGLVIRRVFQKDGAALPSANCIFEHLIDQNGKLTKIVAHGGGFGHAVGMSQYGAGFMATHYNKSFEQILKWYYRNVSIATMPVLLSADSPHRAVTQGFYTTKKAAALVIDNKFHIPALQVTINGKRLNFNLVNPLPNSSTHRIDIAQYVKSGKNTISFHVPSGTHGGKSIKLYVEISKSE